MEQQQAVGSWVQRLMSGAERGVVGIDLEVRQLLAEC